MCPCIFGHSSGNYLPFPFIFCIVSDMILKKTSQREIKWCVPTWNADTQAYNMLVQVLGQDADAFAQCSVGNGYYQWFHKINTLKSLEEFDQDIQAKAKLKISELAAKLEKKLPSIADSIIKYPSDDYIFCSTEGGLHVVLAGWGFVSIGKTSPKPTIEDLPMPGNVHPVRVAFVKNGFPVPARSFFIKNAHTRNEYMTDKSGFYCIGMTIKPGVEIILIDKRTQKPFTLLVDESREDYFLDVTDEDALVNMITDFDITVTNQEGTMTPDYPLIVNNDAVTSGYDGVIRFSNVTFCEAKNQVHVKNADGDETIYYLSEDSSKNHFIYTWNQRFRSLLHVMVMSDNGEKLSKHSVKISVEGTVKDFVSNEEGVVFVEDLSPNTDIVVIDGSNPNNYVDVHLDRGDNNVVLKIPILKPKMVRIGLHDSDSSPLCDTLVTITTTAGTFTYCTDSAGDIWMPFEYFVNKKKVKFSFVYRGMRISKNASL